MLLGLLFLLLSILNVKGEDCIAGAVTNLRIHFNSTLTWDVDPDEPCEIDEFYVEILAGVIVYYRFRVRETYTDASFLDLCMRWVYTVTPVSGEKFGDRRQLTAFIPLPSDTDLTLSHFKAVKHENNVVSLEWGLTNPIVSNCFARLDFRLVLTDVQSGETTDYYVRAMAYDLNFLSPCVPYELSIRAINSVDEEAIEGPSMDTKVEMDPYPEDPPTLSSIESTPTGINMVWKLESYMKNRCPVINFLVDGGKYFNVTLPMRDHFGRAPVTVNLTQLQPDRLYYFKVSVKNLGGISPVVPMAAQTLELEPGMNYFR